MARIKSRRRRVGKGAPRYPPSEILKMRQMRKDGASIDEIAEAFDTGKSTIWPHVHDVKVDDGIDRSESPGEPEKRVTKKAEPKKSSPVAPPPPPRPVVTVTSQVPIEPELVGILAGLALKAGHPNLSEYLRKEGIPWLQTMKETMEEQINSYNETSEAYRQAIALSTELFETRRLLLSRERREADRRREQRDFVQIMDLLGHNPDEIERLVSQLERLDPSTTKGDPSAAIWTQPLQPTPRPRAPPPIVIEKTPMLPDIKPSRLDSELDKQSKPTSQPVSKQSPDEAIASEVRNLEQRLDLFKRKNESGRAGSE